MVYLKNFLTRKKPTRKKPSKLFTMSKHVFIIRLKEDKFMAFIGRKEEISILQKAYSTNNYEGIVIYGRRRIGKSELIKESYRNSSILNLYYECVDASDETNAKFLSEKLAKAFNIPTPDFKSIRECLIYIFKMSLNTPLVFVLDEYPYLRKNNNSLDSIIQTIVDEYKNKCQLKFIICGSYIAVMEELLSSNNPLYGRFSIKLNVRQMDYLDSSKFYPHMSNEDKVAIYSVFGGVPFYNQFVDDKLSVEENIINLPRFLIRSLNILTNNKISIFRDK